MGSYLFKGRKNTIIGMFRHYWNEEEEMDKTYCAIIFLIHSKYAAVLKPVEESMIRQLLFPLRYTSRKNDLYVNHHGEKVQR